MNTTSSGSKALSVSEIVGAIKSTLEQRFRNVVVAGEVSNLSRSATGHFYFSLSDNDSLINGACFKFDALRNPNLKTLKDGDKVQCFGSVSVYNKRGSFQLIVKKIIPAGQGNLARVYELLKKKLAQEGLFDQDVKLPIPRFPKRIGIITAEHGAALRDFISVYQRGGRLVNFLISPALVQGETAPRSIRHALEKLIRYHQSCSPADQLDVIVLTRGGGSMEDLWAFNDEALAWDIYNCPIPIVSAVGHEVDFTICDMVADKRCETPSSAAEQLSSYQNQLRKNFHHTYKELFHAGSGLINSRRAALFKLTPQNVLNRMWERLGNFRNKLQEFNLAPRAMHLTKIQEYQYELDELYYKLNQYIKQLIPERKLKLERYSQVLNALGPQQVLDRGFTLVYSKEKEVLTSSKKFNKLLPGEELTIQFKDGKSKASSL